MIKVLIYLFLFGVGMVVGNYYFNNMMKNFDINNISKGQVIKSMLLRLPLPVIAFFFAGFVGGVWGILSLFAGFSIFQIYYFIKMGGKLKEELEKEVEELENNAKTNENLIKTNKKAEIKADIND